MTEMSREERQRNTTNPSHAESGYSSSRNGMAFNAEFGSDGEEEAIKTLIDS